MNVSYLKTLEDGTQLVGTKMFDRLMTPTEIEWVKKNLKRIAGKEMFELFLKDVSNKSLFAICKSGKSLMPFVAFNPSDSVFEGWLSIRKRYSVRISIHHHDIDITLKPEIGRAHV